MKDLDSELMIRFQRGESSAFDELVRRNRRRVLNFVFRYVGEPDAAEDVAQEVFLRVFRARATYRPTARYSTWLFRIAINLSLNAIRDRSKQKPLSLNRSWTEKYRKRSHIRRAA